MRLFQIFRMALAGFVHRLVAEPIRLGTMVYDWLEWLYYLRVKVWLIEGEEQHSHLPMRVLCGLRNETKNYLLKVIFGDCYRQRYLGRFWLWNVSRAIPAASPCSMILLWTCDAHLKRFARRNDWFLLPDWVLGEVDLPRDAAATRRVRGALQKIRQNSLGFQVTRDPRQFDDFYSNMYVPYTRKTFGNCAYIYSHRILKRIFLSGDLLLVEREGKTLAGVLIDYEDSTPHLFLLGVRDADRAAVRDGAGGAALFYFGLQYLQEKGHEKALLGWSRPFFRDGVLEFKRRWSQVICDSRYWGFGLRVLSPTLAVKSFLRNNPFMFKQDDLLYGAVFLDADKPLSPRDVQQITKDHLHAGLSGVKIYRLPQGAARVPAPAAELPERVELCMWPSQANAYDVRPATTGSARGNVGRENGGKRDEKGRGSTVAPMRR
jgi:hypothetical protein